MHVVTNYRSIVDKIHMTLAYLPSRLQLGPEPCSTATDHLLPQYTTWSVTTQVESSQPRRRGSRGTQDSSLYSEYAADHRVLVYGCI